MAKKVSEQTNIRRITAHLKDLSSEWAHWQELQKTADEYPETWEHQNPATLRMIRQAGLLQVNLAELLQSMMGSAYSS
jgi:hypothetical protein